MTLIEPRRFTETLLLTRIELLDTNGVVRAKRDLGRRRSVEVPPDMTVGDVFLQCAVEAYDSWRPGKSGGYTIALIRLVDSKGRAICVKELPELAVEEGHRIRTELSAVVNLRSLDWIGGSQRDDVFV